MFLLGRFEGIVFATQVMEGGLGINLRSSAKGRAHPPPTLLMLSGGRDASCSALRGKNKKRDGIKMQTTASAYFYS